MAALTVTLVATAQPAAAATTYRTVPVYNYKSWKLNVPKAMAVLNASTGNTAPLVQYRYVPSAPYNDVMILEIESGGLTRIKPSHTNIADASPYNDKCLAIKNNATGWNQPIVNATCSYDANRNDEWMLETFAVIGENDPIRRFRSVEYPSSCIVVQNASIENNAALITHQCVGDNSAWVF